MRPRVKIENSGKSNSQKSTIKDREIIIEFILSLNEKTQKPLLEKLDEYFKQKERELQDLKELDEIEKLEKKLQELKDKRK